MELSQEEKQAIRPRGVKLARASAERDGKEPRWFPGAAAEVIASAWRRSFSPGCNFLILFRRGRLKRFVVVTPISRRITFKCFAG